MYAHEVHAYEVHAHKVQACEAHTHKVQAREINAHEVHASEMIVSGLHRHRRYRRFLPTRVWPVRIGTLPASVGYMSPTCATQYAPLAILLLITCFQEYRGVPKTVASAIR